MTTRHPSISIRPLRAGTTMVWADTGNPAAQRSHLSALKRTIEGLGLPVIAEVSRDGKRLRLECCPGGLSALAICRAIEAADSAVRFASSARRGTRHTLRVRLGGSPGPELAIAALLWGTTEKLLVRRLTRVPHVVHALAPPTASPLLSIPSAHSDWPPASGCRTEKAVDAGALALSESGITLVEDACYISDLVIGHILETPYPRILVGDQVRLLQY